MYSCSSSERNVTDESSLYACCSYHGTFVTLRDWASDLDSLVLVPEEKPAAVEADAGSVKSIIGDQASLSGIYVAPSAMDWCDTMAVAELSPWDSDSATITRVVSTGRNFVCQISCLISSGLSSPV